MVKSKSSCLKLFTCGSDSADQDDLDDEPLKRKHPKEKRGWSFGKKSARHRVLSNTAVTELPSTSNKESQVSTTTNFQSQTNLTSEKISISDWKTDHPLSSVANSNATDPLGATKIMIPTDPIISTEITDGIDSLVSTANVNKANHNLNQSSVVVIQTAVRGYLARRTLLKLKNVIKLQAVVRGHLVRRKAVGTLRCVHAITKMQALVRARRARQSLLQVGNEENSNENSRNYRGNEKQGTKATINHSSTEKLLSNAFARQLMQSTPKGKQINIKCDPSEHDSSWNWLERWMSVSSLDSVESKKPESSPQCKENGTGVTASESGLNDLSEVGSFLTDMNYDNTRADTSLDNESSSSQILGISEPVADNKQSECFMTSLASDQPRIESKNHRKSTNPNFIAVQSKFEGLSSTATSSRSTNSSTIRNAEVESKVNRLSSADSQTKTKEPNLTENLSSNKTRVEAASSDCGSLLSITSTLDSPNRSEAGDMVIEQEPEFIEKATSELNETTEKVGALEGLNIQPKTGVSVPQPNLSNPASVQPESNENINFRSDLSLSVDPQKVERLPERSASDVLLRADSVIDQHSFKSSPEGSPKSHVTISESHGTPSSQVSVNAKRNKMDKSKATQGRKYQTPNKRSPSNQDHDSGSRSSIEQLPKDPKSGKWRNSFGSPKSKHLDQEPKDSSSSSSLPNYMQATESARAKAQLHISPRSSPDIQDKDIYIKKRHSLPATNGKQGSPRIQRSMSQAQPGAKGSSTNSPHEKKWIR